MVERNKEERRKNRTKKMRERRRDPRLNKKETISSRKEWFS